MKEFEINSIKELYERLLPAFHSKIKELKSKRIYYIKEQDIWTYLQKEKWENSTNLSLNEMVNDILHLDIDKFNDYYEKLVKDENK